MKITDLLAFAVKSNASDLHISAGLSPMVRVDGELRHVDVPALDHKTVLSLLYEIMNDKQRKEYDEHYETDFSFDIPELARFRANVFNHERGAGGVFRLVPSRVQSLQELGLPDVLEQIADLPQGLVLVTGPTGSGKSTTLAAIIESINNKRHSHIITIEDPVEFVHESKKCLINQRQVHRDTVSFSVALRSALREDPDIILVGELRDLETIRLALTAAETGHLVFATLHTSSATKTINRIIDVFPGEEKNIISAILSQSLQAVVAQTLLQRKDDGRVAALEIMLCTDAIRHLIREDKVAQMYSAIQTGHALGMQTLDQHLQALLKKHSITAEAAKQVARDKSLFM